MNEYRLEAGAHLSGLLQHLRFDHVNLLVAGHGVGAIQLQLVPSDAVLLFRMQRQVLKLLDSCQHWQHAPLRWPSGERQVARRSGRSTSSSGQSRSSRHSRGDLPSKLSSGSGEPVPWREPARTGRPPGTNPLRRFLVKAASCSNPGLAHARGTLRIDCNPSTDVAIPIPSSRQIAVCVSPAVSLSHSQSSPRVSSDLALSPFAMIDPFGTALAYPRVEIRNPSDLAEGRAKAGSSSHEKLGQALAKRHMIDYARERSAAFA